MTEKNPRAATANEKKCECKECKEASDGKTPATMELIHSKEGWSYDLQTANGRSIMPAGMLPSRARAIAHAKECAHMYGIRITAIEYVGCEAGC